MSESQGRTWYARNGLVALGVFLLAATLALTVVSTNPLRARTVQMAFPVAIGAGLVAYGYRHHATLARTSSRPFIEWIVATMLYFVFVGIWFFVLSRTFETSVPLAILTSIATGLGFGAVIGVYALRLHEANDDLVQANDELSAFASIVSHDLRNPVQVASGSLDLLKHDVPDDDVNVERIEHSLDRIETIIENVLVLTRGAAVVDAKPVPVGAVAERAWETTDAPQATLRLDDPPQISADPDLLATLLENLFRNASDHTSGPVTVTVGTLDGNSGSTDEKSRTAHGNPESVDGFFVADDGPGITEAGRESIFEMGESGDDGTGIGLFVVGRVADVHGWRYGVTESASGGARFEFYT